MSSLEPIEKLPPRFLRAAKVRIKSKPETQIKRGWGVRCRGWFHDTNRKVWAGDVGEIRYRLIEGNGWDQLELVAEFSCGRLLPIGELVRPDDEGPTCDVDHGVWRVSITTGDDLDKIAVVR